MFIDLVHNLRVSEVLDLSFVSAVLDLRVSTEVVDMRALTVLVCDICHWTYLLYLSPDQDSNDNVTHSCQKQGGEKCWVDDVAGILCWVDKW